LQDYVLVIVADVFVGSIAAVVVVAAAVNSLLTVDAVRHSMCVALRLMHVVPAMSSEIVVFELVCHVSSLTLAVVQLDSWLDAAIDVIAVAADDFEQIDLNGIVVFVGLELESDGHSPFDQFVCDHKRDAGPLLHVNSGAAERYYSHKLVALE
jgi:hypothetical protein